MAANPTPTSDPELIARCFSLIAGCQDLEVTLGVKQNTAASLQADVEAAQDAQAKLGHCKSELARRRQEFQARDREGELLLGRCRLRLAALFGPAFSPQWEAAGFSDRSTMVPEMFAKRQSLLEQLQGYFTLRPEHESTDMQATASLCGAMHDALSQARSAVHHAQMLQRQAVIERDKALAQLRRRMRGLIRELDLLMEPDDARWQHFGLNIPARDTAPDAVSSVQAEALGHGRVHVRWPAASHATRYRVQLREQGETEFEFAATVHPTEWMYQSDAVDAVIEIRIIAANERGEASPSPMTSVMVR